MVISSRGVSRSTRVRLQVRQVITILCGVMVTLLAMFLAYQVRPSYNVKFGRGIDTYLLDGFHKAEAMDSEPYESFRWTTDDATVAFQDVGDQDFDATLVVNGTRPPGQAPPVLSVTANHVLLLERRPPPQTAEYKFRIPRAALSDGSLVLHIAANPFTQGRDVRELGIVALSLRIAPAEGSARVIPPPLSPLLSVAAAQMLVGLTLIFLGWATGMVLTGALLPGIFAAWLLATDRLWLTGSQWYLDWLPAVFAGSVFILLVAAIGGFVLARVGTGWSAAHRRILLTVMFAAFLVRFAGQLHPQVNVVDLDFHAHRLELVESGQLLFKEYSFQSGGRETFYLPGVYLFMLPLKWLLGDSRLAVMLFTVGLSTLGALLLFYIARRVLRSGRAGLLAGTMYMILPIAIIQFSWGITANIFAEFVSLVVLAILVGAFDSLRPTRPSFWLLALALFVALLSHTGGLQLLLVAFAFTLAILLANRRIAPREKRPVAWAFAALGLAAAVAYITYYANWMGDISLSLSSFSPGEAQTVKNPLRVMVSGSVDDPSLGLVPAFAETRTEWVLGGLRGFWQEAQAYFRVWPILGAILGFLLVRRSTFIRARLGIAVLGWASAISFFALVGLVLNLYVRYMLFALPVVCLGLGLLLSALWSRSRQGPALSLLLLAFFTVEMLALWQFRITYLYK